MADSQALPTAHTMRHSTPRTAAPARAALACLGLAAALSLPPSSALAQTAPRQVPATNAAGVATAAKDIGGISYPTTQTVGGSTLVLNGAGTRFRFVVRVYTAGLYLSGRASTPEAVMAASGPKRLHVVMLRDIDANQLGRLFTRGMQDNVPRAGFSKFIPGTLRMSEIFSAHKQLKKGESFSVDYVPGVGTTVLVNGKVAAEPIVEPEFFNALMSIWLGPQPADEGLKAALLGEEAPAPNTGQN